MALSTKILTILDPTIPLEEMAIADTENSEGTVDLPADSMIKKSEIVGDLAPFIKIEGFMFNFRDITRLELDETKFLPTIKVILQDNSGAFAKAYFPKTKPILNLYIKSKSEKYKPIRNDYLITSIFTVGSDNAANRANGIGMQVKVTGVLFTPNMIVKLRMSYPNMTSYDVLLEIAKSMQLGFATNEIQTNDKMTWLASGGSGFALVQHILAHSYKDESSFFTAFIDKYYNLNFININNMFSEEMDFDKMWQNIISYKTYLKSEDKTEESDEGRNLFLSNMASFKGSDVFISGYMPTTNQGRILAAQSFRKEVGYYDTFFSNDLNEKFLDFFVEPFGSIIPKDDTLKSSTSRNWIGIDYNNNHNNYKFAEYQNQHNLLELKKMNLHISTDGVNLNIIRGMRVPIVIMDEGHNVETGKGGEIIQENTGTEDMSDPKITIDNYYTGFYIVTGIKYIYNAFSNDRFSFSTHITLSKKEWREAPPINKDIEKFKIPFSEDEEIPPGFGMGVQNNK